MKRFLVLFLLLIAGLSVNGAEAPKILIGLDAQPTDNFDIAASLGNALHRYDNGPQKNVTLDTWLTKAQAKNLYVMAQGLQFSAQKLDPSKYWNVVAITQDDEPDLNRYSTARVNPDIFTPTDAPHPGSIGWTRPAVLAARYADWKARWPGTPITVNFNGSSISNGYYKSDLIYHIGYIKASDAQGFDLYPKNNQGDGGHLYWPVGVFDKLKVVGNPVDIYIECSDQALDGLEGSGPKRGPTANEQGTLVWSALGHGAKRLWYFPQRIGSASAPTFKYYNLSVANEARAKDDFASIKKYMNLLANGTRTTIAQTPKVQMDLNKGAQIWPNTETFKWELGNESLIVAVNYVDGTAPMFAYASTSPVVVTPPVPAPVVPSASKVVQEVRIFYTDGTSDTFVRKP